MGSNVLVRYDPKGFVVMEPGREWVFSADPEGRIGLIHSPEGSWKRSRYNRWYRVIREPWPSLAEIDFEAIQDWLPRWKEVWIAARRKAIEEGILTAADLLTRWTDQFTEFHQQDALQFRQIHDAIPMLPPDAYQSLYIRIQEGCPWNRCAFCNLYRDRVYRVVASNELEDHLMRVRGYWRGALRSRHGIFLGDANAIAAPIHLLEERLRWIQTVFPEKEVSEVHSFLDFFAGPRRSETDYRMLRGLGLVRLTLGIESGDAQLMDQIDKPMNHTDVQRLVSGIHSAGIALNLIFLIGLGGRPRKDSHFQESMRLIETLTTGPTDRVYLSPLAIDPHTPYPSLAKREGWDEFSETETKTELTRWQRAIQSIRRIQVSPYHIRQFLY